MRRNTWLNLRLGVVVIYVHLVLALILHSIFYCSAIDGEPIYVMMDAGLLSKEALTADVISIFSSRLANAIYPSELPDPRVLVWLFVTSINPPHRKLVFDALIYLLYWLRLQFFLMENLALLILCFIAIFGPYKIASLVITNARRVDMSLCKQCVGPTNREDSMCLYCWDDIREEQQSIEHIACSARLHESCIRLWVQQGQASVATCPKCQGPLSEEGICAPQGNYVYSSLNLLLTSKRCTLTAAANLLLWCVALTCVDDELPYVAQPAVRILGLLTISTAIWLTLASRTWLAWLSMRQLWWAPRVVSILESVPVLMLVYAWQLVLPMSFETCCWLALAGHVVSQTAMRIMAGRQAPKAEVNVGENSVISRILLSVVRIATVWLW